MAGANVALALWSEFIVVAHTNASGSTSFSELPHGEYMVAVTAPGYDCPDAGLVLIKRHVQHVDRLIACHPSDLRGASG